MTRLIGNKPGVPERDSLLRYILSAIKTCIWQEQVNQEVKDCVAFVILALIQINNQVGSAINSWEKRNYWQKADSYRLKWDWLSNSIDSLSTQLDQEDFQQIIQNLVLLQRKIGELTRLQPMKKVNKAPIWKGSYKNFRNLPKINGC